MRRDQKTLIAAALTAFALWAVPLLRPFGLPLIYLNTHIHELCHALTATATGGRVQMIEVFANGSGVTPITGGSLLLTASAGYVGSTLVGGSLLAFSRPPKQAKTMLWVTFGFLLFSMVMFVRGDLVGIGSGILWLLTLGLLARNLEGEKAVFAAQFLGLELALTSLQAFMVLMQITTSTERQSDALILEKVSGLPAFVWATGWLVFGVVAIVLALVSAWKPAARARS